MLSKKKICQYDSGNKINCLIKRNKKEMQIEVILSVTIYYLNF